MVAQETTRTLLFVRPGEINNGPYAYGSKVDLSLKPTALLFHHQAADVNDFACMDSLVVPSLIPCSAPCHFDLDTVWKYIATMLLLYRLRPMTTTISFEIPSIKGYPTSMGIPLVFSLQPPQLFQSSGRFQCTTPSSLWTAMSFLFFQTILGRFIPCSKLSLFVDPCSKPDVWQSRNNRGYKCLPWHRFVYGVLR